jgi:phenylalanyl-tRNA synthetase beta chain
MKITRRWLEEFIDLEGISTDEIITTLNRIGQEVEGYEKIEVPENVVVGEVIECHKHPNADKLNVCRVNVGDDELQIVCGASNVAAGQFVPVAKIGAELGDFKIKKAKLRGIESFGMICAAREIGLPDFHDGILVLDNSLGELKVGEYVGKYLNDEVIELGVTANRGDCFSVYGIARELRAGLGRKLKSLNFEYHTMPEGIGRIISVKQNQVKHSSHLIKAINGKIVDKLKIKYRLALVDEEFKDSFDSYIKYAMHATGVLLVGGNISDIYLTNKDGVDVFGCESGEYLVGIKNNLEVEDNGRYLINANFADADYVNEIAFIKGLKGDEYFFRASRGSNPDLRFGLEYVLNELKIPAYSGDIDVSTDFEKTILSVDINSITDIIGFRINEKDIVEILKSLGFEILSISDNFIKVKVPEFRNDIKNIQDIAEEILRIYGIDKIPSKPLEFVEKDRTNEVLKELDFERELKLRAVANGFYEAIHFVFDNKERLQKYGFEVLDEHLDLLNPIAKELNTLRSTILLQLLDDVKRNRANGYKRIYLFSSGSVYDKNRNEKKSLAFVVNGQSDYENPSNQGKPKKVDFKFLVDKLGAIIGEFELRENEAYPIAHPYQNAKIIKNNQEIGVIAKLHPKVAKDFDLDDVYFAEIDLEKLKPSKKEVGDIIKFPKVTRDLSVVVDKELSYKDVYDIICKLEIDELKEFYPIDIYDLGDKNSLTIRFIIQANKTLKDEEINAIMDKILKALEDRGIKLR